MGNKRPTRRGEVTEEYIDYNRRDVLATWELAEKLLEEYGKHPVTLRVTKAYSPASIGKAYLREMEIKAILERQPNFPKEYLGYAQSAFFGGRASAHIRKVPVPVVYCDFLSMYPTVNSLMNLWRFVLQGTNVGFDRAITYWLATSDVRRGSENPHGQMYNGQKLFFSSVQFDHGRSPSNHLVMARDRTFICPGSSLPESSGLV